MCSFTGYYCGITLLDVVTYVVVVAICINPAICNIRLTGTIVNIWTLYMWNIIKSGIINPLNADAVFRIDFIH